MIFRLLVASCYFSSNALVTSSDALVSSSFLLLLVVMPLLLFMFHISTMFPCELLSPQGETVSIPSCDSKCCAVSGGYCTSRPRYVFVD